MTRIRITIAVPAALIEAANELACVGGLSEADRGTFTAPRYKKGSKKYAVSSFLATPEWLETMTGPLWEPEWGADLTLAGQAQTVLDFGTPADGETPATPPVPAPGKIAAHQGEDFHAWLGAHLTRLPEPEGEG